MSVERVGHASYAQIAQRAALRSQATATQSATKVAKAQAAMANRSSFDTTGAPFARSMDQAAGAGGSVGIGGIDGALQNISDQAASADRMVIDLASGRDVNLHDTMVQLEKAEISLKYAVQLRNRALNAYEELMRLQV